MFHRACVCVSNRDTQSPNPLKNCTPRGMLKVFKVPFKLLWHFMQWAQRDVHQRACLCGTARRSNVASTDWLMNVNNKKITIFSWCSSAFLIALCCHFWANRNLWDVMAPPHLQDKQGQCIEQCRRIMKGTSKSSTGSVWISDGVGLCHEVIILTCHFVQVVSFVWGNLLLFIPMVD